LSIEERDIANNPTTLNGDIAQIGEVSDNSYNILRGNNITSTIELNGFRIINGNSSSSIQRGGGLTFTNSLNGQINIKNCYFFSNSAQIYGGAIYIRSSKMSIENCDFRNNKTNGGNGGAIFTLNDAGKSTLLISNSKFIGNVSRIGACLANTSGYNQVIIDKCIFTNNVSDISILEIDDFTQARILNSYIIGNTVNDFSPKLIYVSQPSSIETADFEIINCTIAHNYNIYSNTIQSELIKLIKPNYKVRNCIIYGNSKFAGRQMKLGNTISNCLIEGGYTGGINIIDVNPQFVNPNSVSSSNFEATSFDYSLAVTSPAINKGKNSFVSNPYTLDLNNSIRIQGCLVDLGCYESALANTFNETDVITACDSYTWVDGITYSDNNSTAAFTLQSTLGCDSIVALNLNILHSTTGIDLISTCGSYRWLNGITYTESNQSASFTLPNSIGCDSVITLNLTIDPIHLPTSGTTTIASCDSYTWIDGITYTTDNNTATFVLQNAVGCDSTLTLDLTINNATTKTETISACFSYTWINGFTYTASNSSVQHILQNSQGCDSIVSLNLTILNPTLNISVSLNGTILKANEQNATYQWIDCEDNSSIEGATNQTYTVEGNGTYAVVLTSSICSGITATSACQVIDLSGLSELSQQNVHIFPNPAQSTVFIESNTILNRITIIDLTGKIIESKKVTSSNSFFDLNELSIGVYTIELIDTKNVKRNYKVVKN